MRETTPTRETEAVSEQVADALARKRVRRFSAVEFLVVLVLWLITLPLVMWLKHGDLIEAVLATVVMLSAVVAVGARRSTLIVGILLAAPPLTGKWVNHFRPDLMPPEVFTTGALVFMVLVVVQLLRFILRTPRVSTEVLCAGISAYLLMGILWAFAYFLVDRLSPDSFLFSVGTGHKMAGMEAIYFSFVTLSTIGYGDIIPTSHMSRMLAILEAMTGMFYVTVLIARLVAMHSTQKRPDEAGGEGRP